MLIIQARALGMCFGVEDALELAGSLERPEEVTILGEIVHNPQVMHSMEQRGFLVQPEDSRQQLPPSERVLVTAHGISERYRQRLQEASKEIVDTTCPLVTRVHKMASFLHRQGYRLVLVGKPGHVEVLGITEDYPDTAVLPHPTSVTPGLGARLAVLAQTTTPPSLFEEVLEAVRTTHPQSEVRAVDTVCRPTRDRQSAIRELLARVEAVVVVGGPRSNNTLRLVEQARQCGLPAWRVDGPEDLEESWFAGVSRVGLTAGTSTPRAAIEGVHRRLLGFARRRPARAAIA